jgi:hypothetical protein
MKIHCAQLVEGALRSALEPGSTSTKPAPASPAAPAAPSLLDNFSQPKPGGLKIVMLDENKSQ